MTKLNVSGKILLLNYNLLICSNLRFIIEKFINTVATATLGQYMMPDNVIICAQQCQANQN